VEGEEKMLLLEQVSHFEFLPSQKIVVFFVNRLRKMR